ncbi:hypothetical protein RugamoR64_14990 [Duganella rhizosphaerae]|uniref:flagellar filament capping protein FliD n=1 Tax=Duganella rhizosphaerae TaxID=2885763 RepID=UPI0030EABFA9
MFPISSASLTTPANVAPVAESAAVAPVQSDRVAAAGSATDAPAAASVSIELSPVANFLLTVSQSQEQLTQLQAAVANGAEPRQAAASLNDTTQNVVNAFNLLPAVDFNQAQPQGPSLLNNLVQSLQQQTFGNNTAQPQQTAAQSLAQIGVTLQAPLLADATGGLSLDNEVLRASFNTNQQNTTQTLQNTLTTFSELATRFAEQLSAAGTGAVQALAARQQAALTPADVAATARLDLARAELDQLSQQPLQETAADRLAAQRATLEQPANTPPLAPPSPIVNPLQASTADVIAAQNAEAAKATAQAGQTPAAAEAASAAQQAQTDQSAAAQAQAAQNAATQVATVQASTLQNDPLRANPALAAAIAAYNINDTGANAHTAQTAADAIPRVPAVEATARSRALGNAP